MSDTSAYTKTECMFYHTEYCNTLGATGCSACFANKYEKEQMGQIKDHIDLVRGMLPNGSIAELSDAETCYFCKGKKREKSCYALVDYAHREPVVKKVSAIGIKVKSQVGSLLTLQIACCDRCKKNIRYVGNIALIVTAIGLIFALIMLGISPVRESLEKIHELLPFGAFIGWAALAVLLGKLVAIRTARSISAETVLDVREIPYIEELEKRGWFSAMSEKNGIPRILFSKTRIRRGWFL